jgi:hypothetical protein
VTASGERDICGVVADVSTPEEGRITVTFNGAEHLVLPDGETLQLSVPRGVNHAVAIHVEGHFTISGTVALLPAQRVPCGLSFPPPDQVGGGGGGHGGAGGDGGGIDRFGSQFVAGGPGGDVGVKPCPGRSGGGSNNGVFVGGGDGGDGGGQLTITTGVNRDLAVLGGAQIVADGEDGHSAEVRIGGSPGGGGGGSGGHIVLNSGGALTVSGRLSTAGGTGGAGGGCNSGTPGGAGGNGGDGGAVDGSNGANGIICSNQSLEHAAAAVAAAASAGSRFRAGCVRRGKRR